MKPIDKNAAILMVEQIPLLTDKNQSFNEGCRYMQKRVLRILHTSKTIDAVPVVLCKDCKHYWKNVNTFGYSGVCTTVSDNDFCSYGERRGDG